MKCSLALAAVAWTAATSAAYAADPPLQTTDAPAVVEAPTAPETAPALLTVPAGTLVDLQLAEPVNSKLNFKGDRITLLLVSPIMADGHVLVPAGTRGVGEVIDATPAGMLGKAGELLLAARYLDFKGQKIPLRAFKLGGRGKDNSNAVMAVSMAVGLPGMFIRGGNMQIETGTDATAKLAADLTLPASSDAAQAAVQPEAVQPSTITQEEKPQ